MAKRKRSPQELDEELGYSKYDYRTTGTSFGRNKETDNNRNGHSSKTLKTSFGEIEKVVRPRLSCTLQCLLTFKYKCMLDKFYNALLKVLRTLKVACVNAI